MSISEISVGIVTRTKDRTVLLRRALESVLHQSHQNWHLVVVNDGGDPAPVDRLVQNILGPDDRRVRVIHHPNSLGMEAASNAGITVLDTDYAIIHDDDDSWAPEFLSVALQTLKLKQAQFPTIRGIVTRLNAVYENVTGNLIQIDRVEPWNAGPFDLLNEGFLDLQKILVRNQFPPIAFLFDLSICKDLGMFDASLPVLGDWDFHTRFALKHDIWIHPEYLAFYHHRVSATGALGNTVYDGASKHRMYAQILRNKWIRAAANGQDHARMLLLLGLETQDQLNEKQDQLNQKIADLHLAIAPAASQIKRKNRSAFRNNLSSWFKSVKAEITGGR